MFFVSQVYFSYLRSQHQSLSKHLTLTLYDFELRSDNSIKSQEKPLKTIFA